MKHLWTILCLLALLVLFPQGDGMAVSGGAEVEEEKYVALTFDDGPRRDTTTALLDGLRERGAHATFFLIGEQIPGQEDLVERMRQEGHQVGNHTWAHVKLQGQSRETVEQQVGRTDRALRNILGEGDYWLRPPYGLINPKERAWVQVPMVHWTIDPEDWKVLNADKVVRAVLSRVEPGNIILLHDIYPTSVAAALRIVDTLQSEGYTFVTVEELLALAGTEAEPGEMYLSAWERSRP